MKKSYFIRNSLLAVFAVGMAIFAGGCSKDPIVMPDGASGADLQTRATPFVYFFCFSDGVSIGGDSLKINQTYNFNVLVKDPDVWLDAPMTVIVVEGPSDGYTIESADYRQMNVRFNEPGVYQICANGCKNMANGLIRIFSEKATYRVLPSKSIEYITGPSSVVLGGVYNFKVHYVDPLDPDPGALEITESAFNDPQYTIVSSDGTGNYRIRFNEPGGYMLRDSRSGEALYQVSIYYRPYVKAECFGITQVGSSVTSYMNRLNLCDPQTQATFTTLPFRVYFKYETIDNNLHVGEVAKGKFPLVYLPSGTVVKQAGDMGWVSMPMTDFPYCSIIKYTGDSDGLAPMGYYWKLSYPLDYVGPIYSAEIGGGLIAN